MIRLLLRLLFDSGSSACPLQASLYACELPGKMGCLPCLVSSSWPFCLSSFHPEDCFFSLVSSLLIVSFFLLHCFYRSMLSGVFRFVLPEISSHFVLQYLLHSFLLERLVSSSRVPLWDLSRVLSFLRGPLFAPLSSCPLQELTRKVLFLLALVTTRRVGELQAVSSVISFSAVMCTYLIFRSFGLSRSPKPSPPFFPHSVSF